MVITTGVSIVADVYVIGVVTPDIVVSSAVVLMTVVSCEWVVVSSGIMVLATVTSSVVVLVATDGVVISSTETIETNRIIVNFVEKKSINRLIRYSKITN